MYRGHIFDGTVLQKHWPISELNITSLGKQGVVQNHSYEFNVNEISFSYERMDTNTRFEKELGSR